MSDWVNYNEPMTATLTRRQWEWIKDAMEREMDGAGWPDEDREDYEAIMSRIPLNMSEAERNEGKIDIGYLNEAIMRISDESDFAMSSVDNLYELCSGHDEAKTEISYIEECLDRIRSGAGQAEALIDEEA